MSRVRSSDLLRQMRMLFGAGTVTGLSDGELLERFASRSAAAAEDTLSAEAAFEALVARHGPMVLGVCRRALHDPRDVEDAFQATFLVLVRRAGSVRLGDSLGRWLYGVSRRVAAKARRRALRARDRTTPLNDEQLASEPAADQAERLAALDDEVSRLPEKYRAPVILCYFEGLSHAEAAARLRWPVGTVSGRLSRARGLLKDRLVRRGVAPVASSLGVLLASDGVSAALPQQLVTATVRAAIHSALGGVTQTVSASTSVLALTNEVLRAAVAFKLKAAAVILLACAVAGAAAAGAAGKLGAQSKAPDHTPARRPFVATQSVRAQPTSHRSADEIVKEIEALLAAAERPFVPGQWTQTHEKIAALVDELRTLYPDDPRTPHYLPERWQSLSFLHNRPMIYAEIGEVLRTSRNHALKTEALLFEMCFKLSYENTDGRIAVSWAESFARQAPHDERAGELFCVAEAKLDDDWYLRLGLLVLLAAAAAGIVWVTRTRRAGARRSPLEFAVRLGGMALLLLLALVFIFRFLPYAGQRAIAWLLFGWLNLFSDRAIRLRVGFIASSVLQKAPRRLELIAGSGSTGLIVVLAFATALVLIAARRRLFGTPSKWTSAVRLPVLGFIAVLAGAIAIDALLLARQRAAVEDRIVREYPRLFHGRLDDGEHWNREYKARLIENKRKQRERLGKPFDLEFVDAISGKQVSMKALRGKIVVVDFWATDRGPWWIAKIPTMKQLYAEYHAQGVEFIGVSLNLRDVNPRYESLNAFVARERIPWPQYYDVSETERGAMRPVPADRLLGATLSHEGFQSNRVGFPRGTAASEFAESWGAYSDPTVFLIDAEGNLYSTEARDKLDRLIPRLLDESIKSSSRK